MKCITVQNKLAGYLDDAVTGNAPAGERAQIGEHLNGCTACRAELETFRKLSVLLSRVPKNAPPAKHEPSRMFSVLLARPQKPPPPADLAVRIKVAAAQAQTSRDWPSFVR